MKVKTASHATDLSRRTFLSGVSAGGALATVAPLLAVAPAAAQQNRSRNGPQPEGAAGARAAQAFDKRYQSALAYLQSPAPDAHPTNGDEDRYFDFRASFCKTLPQNDFGEVDAAAFEQLRGALAMGTSEVVERVPSSPVAERGLANPLAAHAFEMIGPDGWSLRMPAAPAFASAKQAAEMGEVYWQALTRDVPFREYASNPDIAAAVYDLNAFSHRLGADGEIAVGSLFRGETPGDLAGPYISQFLWQPASWGVVALDQRFVLPQSGRDFGLTEAQWISIQRGAAPLVTTQFEAIPRHISTGRDLAEFVHNDVVYQAYLTSALVMLGMGDDALDANNPYFDSGNQIGFVTFGAAEIVDLVAKAANAALKAAWFQKWLVHRRLRPEVFAARAEFQDTGARAYDIHSDLFSSDVASRLRSTNGSLLLPLAYPEGSPTHPSYPAGHAAVAGACATVLKAVFNEGFEVPEPVQASADGLSLDAWTGPALTLGDEINKLASNIAIGRDTAGVHYRSDGIDGMHLGEQVALGILTDYAGSHAERFAGFGLTRFDGLMVRVSGDGATPPRPQNGDPRRPRRRPRRENA